MTEDEYKEAKATLNRISEHERKLKAMLRIRQIPLRPLLKASLIYWVRARRELTIGSAGNARL